ncbi:MAG: nickel pincer cofactor biosynthesis protein LarC [Angustibacter sp.]
MPKVPLGAAMPKVPLGAAMPKVPLGAAMPEVTAGSDVVWVDAGHGASGDMLLAALWDVGVPAAVMADAVAAVVPAAVTFERERRHGFDVARAFVHASETDAPHRTWADVRALLTAADLPSQVRDRAHRAFGALAAAEGRVHGVAAEAVHFHEVGAHDAIADVVGACAGFGWLGSMVQVGPIGLGGGTVDSDHGVLPVPGPAVLELLTGSGAPASGGPVDIELCTPTGAALLTTLADSYGAMPAMRVDRVGSGCGSRVLPDRVGALRLVRGTLVQLEPSLPAAANPLDTTTGGALDVTAVCVLETNVDDLDPRLWPGVLAQLLDAGASDAWLSPILMKKGRPAHTLHVLADDDPATLARLRDIVLTHTSAIGLRHSRLSKTALPREEATVDVHGQPVRVKLARLAGRVVNAQPEYDDVAAAALTLGVPAKTVLGEAARLAADLPRSS